MYLKQHQKLDSFNKHKNVLVTLCTMGTIKRTAKKKGIGFVLLMC
jgi:hypothetical protein